MGFTVSLFVAGLAFPNRELEAAANVGITIASAAAAIAGHCCPQEKGSPGSQQSPANEEPAGS